MTETPEILESVEPPGPITGDGNGVALPPIQQEAKQEPEEDVRQGLPPSVKVETGIPLNLSQKGVHSKGPWIQYNGVGTLRVMTKEDWHRVGVDSSQYCEWNYLNKKRLPRSSFSDEELQYLLNVDGRFSVVDAETASV